MMAFDLSVGSVGLLPDTEQALKTMLAALSGGRWRYIEDGAADIWLVDMDLANGAGLTAQTFPPLPDGRRPLIVLFGDELDDDAGLVLRKPLRRDELQRVLERAVHLIGPVDRSTAEHIVRQVGERQPLAAVLFACGVVRVLTDNGVDLWMDLVGLRYLGDGDAFLAAMAAGTELTLMPVDALPGDTAKPLGPLLWRLVHEVRTPPLPIWLRPDHQLRLREWSEIESLSLTQAEVRMASLLLRRPASMMELGPLTGTRPRDVRRFLAGTAALQLLYEAPQPVFQTPGMDVGTPRYAAAGRAFA